MAKKKVLFCIDSLIRGGTELQLLGLISHLDRSQFTPIILTIRRNDKHLVPTDCQVMEWEVPSLFSPHGVRQLLRLVRFLRSEQINVVQTYFQDSTMFAGLAAYLARVPVRLACCRDLGFWHTKTQGIAMSLAYRLMTGYICNARIIRDHFSKMYAIDPARSRVIPNGVTISDYRFHRHSEGVSDIGIVGNMTRQVKRIDLFLNAAALVASEYPEIRWHIIGDGHLKQELQAQAESNGLSDRVIFTGRIDNIPEYLDRLQIGVICSDSEGLSNAIIEYMLKGVATVATNVGGNPELVIDARTGLLSPPGDAAGLARNILTLIKDDRLRQTLATNARRHIESSYGWDACLRQYEAAYSQTEHPQPVDA